MGVTYVANPMITFFNCHEGWFDVSSIYGKIGDSLGIVYCWVYHITYCNLFIVVYIETYYTTTSKYVTYITYIEIWKYNLENKISKILLFQVFL